MTDFYTPTNRHNTAIGFRAGTNLTTQSGCTIIGSDVAAPDSDDTLRIGTGGIFLEVSPAGARVVGTESVDEAVEAVLAGISHAGETMRAAFKWPDAA